MVDCLLGRDDGAFDYHSYLALPLLDLIDDPLGGRGHERGMVAALAADIVRFETRFAHDDDLRLASRRPHPARVTRRLRHAVRLATTLSQRPSTTTLELLHEGQCDDLPGLAFAEHEDCLRYSLLPISTEHDEYLFIRVIQCYELVFREIARHLSMAVEMALDDRVPTVADFIVRAAQTLDATRSLFSLLATMQPDSFRALRDLTAGAGAIQSRTYEQIELLCGMPRRSRPNSAAFHSVAEVREQALGEPDSLSSWYLRSVAEFDIRHRRLLDHALARLKAAHQRLKRAHRSLAAAMIEERPGAGQTARVAPLEGCTYNRLFWKLGSRHRHGGAHRSPCLSTERWHHD
jgi:tryptophan 2,3-dioxygenase